MSRVGSLLNNQYRLEAELGQGNFATVYLATDLIQKGQVVVKLLDQHWSTDPAFLERFTIQARFLMGLNHPNILPVADFGLLDITPFLVMPLIKGGTLLTRLRQGRLSLSEIEVYLEQITRALDYAHQRGIIHGDLKPGNIFLAMTKERRVMLTDFGLATLLNNPPHQKTPAVAIGNPAYMAPEQFQGYTFPASDLYACGILLFQMLTEKLPFRGSFEQIAAGHARGTPPPLASTASQLPADLVTSQALDQVILKALAKQPVDRYPTGQALAQAYRESIKAAPIGQPAGSDADLVTPVQPQLRQNKAKIAEAVDSTVRASPETRVKPAQPPVMPSPTRYVDLRFPEQLTIGQQGWLEISLTLTEAAVARIARGEDSGEMLQGRLEPLTVSLNAPGFAVEGAPAHELEFLPNRNSGPLKFLLTARDQGQQPVSLTLWQHGKFAGRIELSSEVTGGQVGAKPLRGRAITRRYFRPPDQHSQPPDLQIYINSSPLPDGSQLLDFSLTYFENRRTVVAEPAGQLKLSGDAKTGFRGLFKRLNSLIQQSKTSGRNLSDQDIHDELERIGKQLYRDYFPADMKAAYLRFRRNVHTLLIISNETGLPWELAYPYDESDAKGWQDGFLCERFVLTRWLADAPGLPGRVPLTVACCVVPGSNLNSAQEELSFLRRQSQQQARFRLVTPFLSHKSEVLNRLEQDEVNLFQFICRAEGDKLRLEDGEEFSPADLGEKIEESLARTKPFVFFNLCRQGTPDFTPVEIGTWAERLLAAGASLLLGTYWEVNDKLAAEFSRIFYEELFGGASFGEACAVARQHIRKFDPANSTWLAYTLYANPTGQITSNP
jgi:serine/threonine protein kinase